MIITQSGLGLPDRDYYLKDDAGVRGPARQVRRAHHPHADADRRADSRRPRRRRSSSSRRRSPRLHWPARQAPRARPHLQPAHARGARGDGAGVLLGAAARRPRAWMRSRSSWCARPMRCRRLAQLFLQVPVETLARLLQVPLPGERRRGAAAGLRRRRCSTSTAARCKGQPQQRARWKRAVRALDNELGEAVGELYVERYFPPSSKQQVRELVENLRADLRRSASASCLDERRPPRRSRWRSSRPSTPRSAIRTSGATTRTLSIVSGRRLRQRHPRARLRVAPRGEAAQRADRSRRVGHDAADHQRLLQLDLQRGGVPGGDPAAAVLRSERRRGGQLRRRSAR